MSFDEFVSVFGILTSHVTTSFWFLSLEGWGPLYASGMAGCPGPGTFECGFECVWIQTQNSSKLHFWLQDRGGTGGPGWGWSNLAKMHPKCIQMQHALYHSGSLSTEIMLVLILDADVHVDARHRFSKWPRFSRENSLHVSFRLRLFWESRPVFLHVIYTT